MKKRIFVFSPSTAFVWNLPALLLNFQRHHEQFGRHPDSWEWCDPIFDFKYKDVDELAKVVVDDIRPDVLCLGVYVWNEDLCIELGKRVKEALPNCMIVIGGSQISFLRDPTWFDRHPFITYGCHVDGYGEMFMTELLDQITEDNIQEDKVPLLCKPIPGGYVQLGPNPNKREFIWPKNIYDKNDERLVRWVAEARERKEYIAWIMETTRGCPYSCTYCEWGGGIGTKVVQKPFEQVLEEIDVIASLGVYKVWGSDANFGILARDIEIAQYLADTKKRTGYPKMFEYLGPAKNNQERVEIINDIVLGAGMMGNWSLNLQSLDDEVLKNIKRTDLPLQKRIESHMKLIKKYNLDLNLQFIHPLPGWGWRHFLDEIDFQSKYTIWNATRFELQVLPNTEMADPENIEKFGLKLKRVHWSNELPDQDDGQIKNVVVFDPARVDVDDTTVKDLRYKYSGCSYSVTSSNAITGHELINVRWTIANIMVMQMYGMLADVTDWLDASGTRHSSYFDKFVNDWLWKDSNSYSKINVMQKFWKDLENDWLGDEEVAHHNHMFPLHEFPFLIDSSQLMVYAWLSDPELLIDWANWITEEFGEKAGDLAELCIKRVINIKWDPVNGSITDSKWDWRPWIYERQEPIEKPTKLRWKQTHFRGQLLPNFPYGDEQTAKLWILYNMYPIHQQVQERHSWTRDDIQSQAYLARRSEEI